MLSNHNYYSPKLGKYLEAIENSVSFSFQAVGNCRSDEKFTYGDKKEITTTYLHNSDNVMAVGKIPKYDTS